MTTGRPDHGTSGGGPPMLRRPPGRWLGRTLAGWLAYLAAFVGAGLTIEHLGVPFHDERFHFALTVSASIGGIVFLGVPILALRWAGARIALLAAIVGLANLAVTVAIVST